MAGEKTRDPRRALPATGRVTQRVADDHPELPAWAVTAGARGALAAARELLGRPKATAPMEADVVADAALRAARLAAGRPGRVVNATGVVLHTNLGRAVLAPGAAAAVAEAASHASDLELDLASGARGRRLDAVAEKLVLLSGAEAALAVNNNAAAVMLALDTLGRGREVVVSRGELVEIGGSFRVPEILERAGVRLVEVGTTNRTHARDYEAAIGPDTALLLKVHRSNFEQRGFVAEVELPELAAIAHAHELPLVEDLGSGTLVSLEAHGFPPEALAPARLRQGADLVCFSGDKLLGGPQAGIAIGRRDIVKAMSGSPLARALRLDKLSLVALDWTLRALLEGRGEAEIPALRQLLARDPALRPAADELAKRLADVAGGAAEVGVERDRSAVGGGSLPGLELPTWVVVLRVAAGPDALAAALRRAPLPVVARVRDDAVALDVRTLLEDDPDAVCAALASALEALAI